MSEEKCTPRQTASCEEKVLQAGNEKQACEDFSICLPFGGRLYSEDGCIKVEQGNPPEDGTYGKVLVQNGCIIGLAPGEAAQYTASPCAPVPVPCDCDGEGGITISPNSGNLSALDSQGRLLTLLHTVAGPGIELSGNGTQQNPLTISATGGGEGGGAVSGIYGDAIIIPNRNTGNVTLSHKETGNGVINALGFTIDEYGHVIDYSASEQDGVTGVLGSATVAANTDANTGIVTVSLNPLLDAPTGTTLHGGYNVTVDEYGRVTEIENAINIPAGTYTLGDYDVSINRLGSVTGITRSGGGGGGGDSSIGLSPVGVMGRVQWNSQTQSDTFSVNFSLAKASPVRLLITPLSDTTTFTLVADVDGSVDLNRTMSHLGCSILYTRTKLSAGSHTLHMSLQDIEGGGDFITCNFDIQAFTVATVTGSGDE